MLLRTAAVAVLSSDLRRVLLIRRDAEPFKGSLGFPGGKLESGESFFQAAQRELREEAGIDVESWALVGAFHADGVLMVVFAAIRRETHTHPVLGAFYEICDLGHLDLAPNVAAAAIRARRIIPQRTAMPLLRDAVIAAQQAAGIIRSSLQTTTDQAGNTAVGWDHYLQRRRVGTVGTALGLLALRKAGIPLGMTDLHNVVSTLLDRENRETGGGWGVRGMASAGSPSLVESTCYVLDALRVSGLKADDPPVQRGIRWLLECHRPEGGWGTTGALPARPLPTTLAICTLVDWGLGDSPTVASAVKWLSQMQNRDGGWGIRPFSAGVARSESTAPHTARVVSTLLRAGLSRESDEICRAREWLESRMFTGWKGVTEIEYLGDQHQDQHRLEFRHTAESHAVSALLDAGVSPTSSLIAPAIQRMIEVPAIEGVDGTPVWAEFDRISVLVHYRTCIVSERASESGLLLDLDATLTSLADFYHAAAPLAATVDAATASREQLTANISNFASRIARGLRIAFAMGFVAAVALLVPLVLRRWTWWEPIFTVFPLAVSGLVVILGLRFTPQVWWKRFDAVVEERIRLQIGYPR